MRAINDRNYYLTGLDYGNNDSVQYNYDQYGRLISEIYTDHNQTDTDLKDTVSYYYDNDGAMVAVHDSASGITSRQYYDMSGRNVGYSETAEGFTHTGRQGTVLCLQNKSAVITQFFHNSKSFS